MPLAPNKPDPVPLPAPRPRISHVVFDFDGTLSWLRHGWPEMMCDVFAEHMRPQPGESESQLRAMLRDEIMALNGQPTILQCQRFVKMLEVKGGPQLEAEALRAEFQRRLDAAIASRSEAIRSGSASPGDFLVAGARDFLQHLAARGLIPIILSSTVQHRVLEEAALLQIESFFGRHVYGGTGDPERFRKLTVFNRLLSEERIHGENLLSFGDGPVEIRDTKSLGGLAIAVCSDEVENGSGRLDSEKERHLLAVGADLAIPDFRSAAPLLDHLLGR